MQQRQCGTQDHNLAGRQDSINWPFQTPLSSGGNSDLQTIECKEVLYDLDNECTANMEEPKKRSVWPGWEKNVYQRKMNLALKDE